MAPVCVWRCLAGGATALTMTVTGVVAEPSRSLALTPAGLPSSLIGEAAVVALAFAFPAIVAGLYLVAQRLLRGFGLRQALVLGGLGIALAFGLAVIEQRPDLLDARTVLRLAGL